MKLQPGYGIIVIARMKEVLFMDGIGSLITTMAMGMSKADTMSQASLAMFKKNLDSSEVLSDQLIESISEAVPSAGGSGALMDVRA